MGSEPVKKLEPWQYNRRNHLGGVYLVYLLIAGGAAAFLWYGIGSLIRARDSPVLVRKSLRGPTLPMPGIVFCGICHRAPRTPSRSTNTTGQAVPDLWCPTPKCQIGDFGRNEVASCDDYMKLVHRGTISFIGYPTFTERALDSGEGNCVRFHPPPERGFSHSRTRSDRLNIHWNYDSGTKEEDLQNRPFELVFGFYDTAEREKDGIPRMVKPWFASVLVGTEYVFVERFEHIPLSGDTETTLEWRLEKSSFHKPTANLLSLEVIPQSYDTTREEEQAKYTWYDFLSQLAGVTSFLLLLRKAATGEPRLDPWGFVPRYISGTSPSARCQALGVNYSLEQLRPKRGYSFQPPAITQTFPALCTAQVDSAALASVTRSMERLSQQLAQPTIKSLSLRIGILETVLSKYYDADLAPSLILEMLRFQNEEQKRLEAGGPFTGSGGETGESQRSPGQAPTYALAEPHEEAPSAAAILGRCSMHAATAPLDTTGAPAGCPMPGPRRPPSSNLNASEPSASPLRVGSPSIP